MSQQGHHDQPQAPAALAVVPAPNVKELLKAWGEDETGKWEPRLFYSMSAAFLGLVVMLVLSSQWAGGRTPGLLVPIGVGVLVLIGLIWKAFPVSGLTQAQIRIRDQIQALDDVRAVGPLVDALYRIQPLRETILSTLSHLLTGLTEEEAVELRHQCGPALYDLISWNSILQPAETCDADLIIAILRMLSVQAQRQGLDCVARWIMKDAPTHNEQRIRETAREMLPRMLAQVEFGGMVALPDWIHQLPVSADSIGDLMPALALMQLLPQLTPAEYLALGHNNRQRIYTNLVTMEMPRLKEAYAMVVLDLIRLSADVEALSLVHAVIDGDGGAIAPYPQVRQAAIDCLPILSAQLEKEKVSKTLLRGASAPQGTGDTLLRPASGAPTTDPQLLLRANVQDRNS